MKEQTIEEKRHYFLGATCQFCKGETCSLMALVLLAVPCDGHNGKFHCPFWGVVAAKLEELI